MSGKSGLRAKLLNLAVLTVLAGLPVSWALADQVSGANRLEAVEHGETEGDWVEFWSDPQDGIWIVVVRDRAVVEIIPPGESADKKIKAALLKQRAATGDGAIAEIDDAATALEAAQ